MPTHIAHNIRAGLCLTYAAWRFLDQVALEPVATNGGRPSDARLLASAFRAKLHCFIEHAYDRKELDTPVASYLKIVAALPEVKEIADTAAHTELHRDVSAFCRFINAVNCLACTQNKDEFCDGEDNSRDSAFVAERGLCFKWFTEIHEYCKREADTYVARHFNPGELDKLRKLGVTPDRVGLETCHCRSLRPHGLTYQSNVSAKTTFPSDESLAATIRVIISTHLDHKSIISIPYIICHELIRHSFQAIGAEDGPRERDENGDAFSEGWMDLLAKDFVVIAGRKGGRKPYVFSFEGELARETRKLWDARHDALEHAKCGAELLDWFKKSIRSNPRVFGVARCGEKRAENIAFRFSYLLNIYATRWQTDNFIRIMNHLIHNREIGPKSADGRRLVEAARNFLSHQNQNN